MVESTILKCEICGEMMLARIDKKNNRVFLFCPTMITNHDIYVVNIDTKIKDSLLKKIANYNIFIKRG